jgi:NADH:ubiquinone oxidoreductase subunit 2 (subunit N)
MYWSTAAPPDTPLPLSRPLRVALGGCALAMLVLGVSPQPVLAAALRAAQSIGI